MSNNRLFNILYWNLNYRKHMNRGSYENGKIIIASDLIIDNIKSIIKKYKINVIVFVEAYPFNSIISDKKIYEFLQENGYDVPGYYDMKPDENLFKYKISGGNRHWNYANPIIVAIKKEDNIFTRWEYNIEDPNMFGVISDEKKIFLGGIRLCINKNDKDINQRIKQFDEVKKKVKEFNKIILIGDFNIDINDKTDYIRNNLYTKNNNFGFVVCKNGNTLGNTKIDHLYLKNVLCKKFEVLLDMKDLYGNAKTKNNFYDIISINPPFPDHNLLFASIDIGSD